MVADGGNIILGYSSSDGAGLKVHAVNRDVTGSTNKGVGFCQKTGVPYTIEDLLHMEKDPDILQCQSLSSLAKWKTRQLEHRREPDVETKLSLRSSRSSNILGICGSKVMTDGFPGVDNPSQTWGGR